MAKELPYFKFFPGEWLKGDITMCTIEAQGLFINICTFYWMKDCNMCLTSVQQRFNSYLTQVEELIESEIIDVDEYGNITIKFLDEQMSEFAEISKKRSDAGRASGKKRRTNKCSTNVQQMPNNKEKRREYKDKDIYIPTFDEFLKYAKDNKPDIDKLHLKLKYDSWMEAGWKDGNGKSIKNWKSKLLNTLPYIKTVYTHGSNNQAPTVIKFKETKDVR